MDYRYWNIIDELPESGYKAAAGIGEVLGISEKTVRTRIHDLGNLLEGSGAEIEPKPRYGYSLKVRDRQRWEEFCRGRYERKEEVPSDSNERVEYILAMFLNQPGYIKLETLSEFLFVSTKTLTNELKQVEYILRHFDIRLIRRPHYGICAEGKEFHKRCCILQNFYLSQNPFWGIPKKQEAEVGRIAESLLGLSKAAGIKFAETSFQNTVLYIYLSISRMRKKLYITEEIPPEASLDVEKEMGIARELYREAGDKNMAVPEGEIFYAGIYIAGKRILGNEKGNQGNIVASEKIDGLISRILEEVYLTYQVDLREDLNLRIMLIQHLRPMEIRLKYGIPVEFNMEEDIKGKYFLAYTMAQLAVKALSEAYGKELPENEMLCIAMYFAMALEEQKSPVKRKNHILLVCVSGKASSRMLAYRFQKEFGEYIESLSVCGMYEFEHMDLTDTDFIFTTVPIYKSIAVPILEIHDFLGNSDIMSVRHFLQEGDLSFLNHFYRKELFFSEVPGEDRAEVIHELCMRIGQAAKLPEGFEESVLLREQYGATDFGNLAAIPHPCRIMTEETLVAVAVLKKEITWSVNPVRVVILTSLKEEKSDETQKFYDITAKFLSDKDAVASLVKDPSFETFGKLVTALKR